MVRDPHCTPSGKDSEPRADTVLFFRLEINSREMSSYYLRRPALGVGYVLKLCPDKFSDVLGLKVCVPRVCVKMYHLYDKDENRRGIKQRRKEN